MHELSLCDAIADTVRRHAAGRAVRRVGVRIGHLRQVVPDTLLFCWQVHVDGTALAGCRLDVEYVAATVHCRTCDAATVLDHPILLCGRCDGADVHVATGEELLVVAIDVVDGAPTAGAG